MTDPEVRFAEAVARATTRHVFLKRAAQGTFAALSSWTLTGVLSGAASAHTKTGQAHCANTSGSTSCTPPNGQYCSGCVGHGCPSGYHWSSNWGYNSACWCTLQSGTSYYVCCDCTKFNDSNRHASDCGCRSQVHVGAPEP